MTVTKVGWNNLTVCRSRHVHSTALHPHRGLCGMYVEWKPTHHHYLLHTIMMHHSACAKGMDGFFLRSSIKECRKRDLILLIDNMHSSLHFELVGKHYFPIPPKALLLPYYYLQYYFRYWKNEEENVRKSDGNVVSYCYYHTSGGSS